MGMIKEVLQGLVSRGFDGARVFAIIFLCRVRVLSARRGKMWDYERDEPQEELRDSAGSGCDTLGVCTVDQHLFSVLLV